MKKRIFAILLAALFCVAVTGSAFAYSTSRTGTTSGGTSGLANTRAELSVGTSTASASTWSGAGSGATLRTSLIYYYTNHLSQSLSCSNAGGSSTTCTNSYNNGTSATSQHSVNGGSRWGNWSTSLSASAN